MALCVIRREDNGHSETEIESALLLLHISPLLNRIPLHTSKSNGILCLFHWNENNRPQMQRKSDCDVKAIKQTTWQRKRRGNGANERDMCKRIISNRIGIDWQLKDIYINLFLSCMHILLFAFNFESRANQQPVMFHTNSVLVQLIVLSAFLLTSYLSTWQAYSSNLRAVESKSIKFYERMNANTQFHQESRIAISRALHFHWTVYTVYTVYTVKNRKRRKAFARILSWLLFALSFD